MGNSYSSGDLSFNNDSSVAECLFTSDLSTNPPENITVFFSLHSFILLEIFVTKLIPQVLIQPYSKS